MIDLSKPQPYSNNAEVIIDPSYAGGISYLPRDHIVYDIYIRATPNAKQGLYRVNVALNINRPTDRLLSEKQKYTF